ncbi:MULTISPECIES: glycosyltransferase [unclassified Lysobacter]
MAMSRADLRFLFDRSTGLVQRGLTSLRTRGLHASWQRVLKQLRWVRPTPRSDLYLPAPTPFAGFAVPASQAPVASIVIPVYNQFPHTLGCLRALAAHPPGLPVEIIVIDDGSTDETAAALAQVDGLRYFRRVDNGGFVAACNDGLAKARGEFVVFLNNDTVPQPGWLDALLATFDQHPGTGLVGAQLLYPDGRLQEAGGIVRKDGSADKLGRLESADHCAFNYVRRVDYCSGAAIALPRALLESLGGFDTRYAPAFYEDTDLGMQVRARGLQVLYQPASRVVHTEGATAGTDTRHGVKAYQVRNQQYFRERWHALLPDHPGHTASVAGLTDRLYSRTVLVIDALTPRPDRDSGSLRLVNLMRMLREEGAHVVFIPADRDHDGDYTRTLQQLGVEVWYVPFAARLPKWLAGHGARFYSVLVCRHYVMREMLPLLRRYAPQARLVFDTVDLHYLRERRGGELANDPVRTRAAERTRTLELDVIARSDATLVVSEVERELLTQDAPQARVEVLSNLHRSGGHGLPFEERRDLMFVGGFRHPPNVDAVCWFVESVWPLLRAHEPDLQFHCIGGDVNAEVAALATSPGVIVHGHVPNLTPYLAEVRLSVAPLRYGAGVKGKINQPMAHGQPVVATTCAIEGMHLRAGQDVLVADDAADFAAAVLRAYHDGALWQQLGDNGRANVEQHFSLDAGRAVVQQVLLGRN